MNLTPELVLAMRRVATNLAEKPNDPEAILAFREEVTGEAVLAMLYASEVVSQAYVRAGNREHDLRLEIVRTRALLKTLMTDNVEASPSLWHDAKRSAKNYLKEVGL